MKVCSVDMNDSFKAVDGYLVFLTGELDRMLHCFSVGDKGSIGSETLYKGLEYLDEE